MAQTLAANLIGPVAAALVCSWLSTRLLIPLLRKKGVMDVPNLRSSHLIPTPRGGGVGILVGWIAGTLVAMAGGASRPPATFVVALFAVAGCGLLDDLVKDVPVAVRLLVNSVAAALVVASAGPLQALPLPHPLDLPLGVLGWPVSLVWIVAVVNIYNFLDGIDGFAGFQGLIAGAAIAAMGLDTNVNRAGFRVCRAAFPTATGATACRGVLRGFVPLVLPGGWRLYLAQPITLGQEGVGSASVSSIPATAEGRRPPRPGGRASGDAGCSAVWLDGCRGQMGRPAGALDCAGRGGGGVSGLSLMVDAAGYDGQPLSSRFVGGLGSGEDSGRR